MMRRSFCTWLMLVLDPSCTSFSARSSTFIALTHAHREWGIKYHTATTSHERRAWRINAVGRSASLSDTCSNNFSFKPLALTRCVCTLVSVVLTLSIPVTRPGSAAARPATGPDVLRTRKTFPHCPFPTVLSGSKSALERVLAARLQWWSHSDLRARVNGWIEKITKLPPGRSHTKFSV